MESLFSLEVVINYVKVNSLKPDHQTTNRTVSCLFPSVAFRLLDYPMIAINLLDHYDAKDLKAKLNISEPFEMIEKLPCFTELLDKHGRYIFSKGKSCLFRCDIDTLRGHLRNSPMYLMLLDTYFEPYKLIGTSLVQLTNLINDIYEETYETNSGRVDVPCSKMTHGVIEIKNLMGDEIGHVSFACRLTSFGNSLLPHIETSKTEASQRRLKESKAIEKTVNTSKKSEESKEENNLPEAKETLHYNLKKKTSVSSNTVETMAKNDALIQTIKIDYKDAQIQISDYPNSGKKNKSTQSPNTKRKYPLEKMDKEEGKNENLENIYSVKHVQDEFAFNHFCPPALHYNSKNDTLLNSNNNNSTNTVVNMILNQNLYINKRVEYLSEVANEFEEEIGDDENNKLTPLRLKEGGELHENESQYFIEKPQLVKKSPSEFSFDQMPLLKCLFDEMTKLKSLIENKDVVSVKSKTPSKLVEHEKFSNSKKNVFTLKNKPVTNVELIQSQNSSQLVGILRKTSTKNTSKPNPKPNPKAKKAHRQHLIDSVNRLSQPRAAKSSSKSVKNSISSNTIDFDEMPVGKHSGNFNDNTPKILKKEPLKYGLTKAHRMRVLASRPDLKHQQSIELKHEQLMEKVKSNLDNLSLTSSTKNEETMHKNLEKVLFDTAESTWNNSNLQKNTRSPMNLSLLNKVEMESTYDTMHNTMLLGVQNVVYEEEDEDEEDGRDDEFNSESSSQTLQQTKIVQFGNTTHHRYTTNSTSGQPTTTSQATSTPTNSSNSKNNELTDILNDTKLNQYDDEEEEERDEYLSKNRNIFLDQKNPYDDDFHSSLDSSLTSSTKHSTSTSNFITAAMNKNQVNDSPRSSKSSPRLSPRRYMRKDEQPTISENDEEYDEIEYLGHTNPITNQSLKTSSKYSVSSYYDSLSLSKDAND
jgi:hypothetical protein